MTAGRENETLFIIYSSTYNYLHIFTYMHTYHTRIHECMHVYMYTYIQTYMHANMLNLLLILRHNGGSTLNSWPKEMIVKFMKASSNSILKSNFVDGTSLECSYITNKDSPGKYIAGTLLVVAAKKIRQGGVYKTA